MRVFCQMSVSGFKIFDLNQFNVSVEGGKYVTMADIAETQHGKGNVHTHITGSNYHDLPYDVIKLFSMPMIEMLFQRISISGQERLMFYCNRVGITYDNQNRECETSYLFVQTCDEDADIIKKLALAMVYKGDCHVVEFLQNMVRKDTVNEEYVLFYDTTIYNQICEYVNKQLYKGSLAEGIQNDANQVIVVRGNNSQTVSKILVEHKSLINSDKYWVVDISQLPLFKNTLSVYDCYYPLRDTRFSNSRGNIDWFEEIKKLFN